MKQKFDNHGSKNLENTDLILVFENLILEFFQWPRHKCKLKENPSPIFLQQMSHGCYFLKLRRKNILFYKTIFFNFSQTRFVWTIKWIVMASAAKNKSFYYKHWIFVWIWHSTVDTYLTAKTIQLKFIFKEWNLVSTWHFNNIRLKPIWNESSRRWFWILGNLL